MKRYSLIFTKPKKVEIKKEIISSPHKNQVLVKTIFSSISAGTEMLFYNGEVNKDTIIDKKINCLEKPFKYPLKYGYSTVGKIISIGNKIPSDFLEKKVFVFHPHENYFLANIEDLIIIPKNIKPIEATFLPNVETAINLVMDGSPIIGENIIIYGQGIIGLLTTYLLSLFPLNKLVTVDKFSIRRKKSLELGAYKSIKPDDIPLKYFEDNEGVDLVYELTGDPSILELAINNTKYNGRIIIGSWYGKRKTSVSFGEKLHRNRIQIIGSQVSNINPVYLGRWDKNRRINLCWKIIKKLKPQKFISHKILFKNALNAYEILDKNKDKTLQIILCY